MLKSQQHEKCVRRGPQNGGSIFAHRYLSGDYQNVATELQMRLGQSKTPRGIVPSSKPSTSKVHFSNANKENNPLLANVCAKGAHKSTAKQPGQKPTAALQMRKGSVAGPISPAVLQSNVAAKVANCVRALRPIAGNGQTKPRVPMVPVTKPKCKNPNKAGGCSSPNVSITQREMNEVKVKVNCYLETRACKRPSTFSGCQRSARGSVPGITSDSAATLEGSRLGTERLSTARANSRKPNESAKPGCKEVWQGAKISQLQGRLKDITVSLAGDGKRPAAEATKKHEEKGNVMEKLNALRRRLKSLFNVGTKCVMVMKKKSVDATPEYRHNK